MNMTRQEQLDAVVRNYGEWPEDAVYAYLEDGEVCFVSIRGIKVKNPSFTRAEVEQRKAELQNKPSWDDAPEWAGYLAQNEDGLHCWHENIPHANEIEGIWMNVGAFKSGLVMCEVIGDWRDTLEKRPNADDRPTPEEEEAFRDCVAECLEQEGAAKWSGEGLPPVGAECYVQLAFIDMGKCRITYMDDDVFCYRQCSSGNEYTGLIRDTIFSPIKSDREQWIDKALDVEAEMPDGYQPYEFLHALYDAGLGKMPEAD